MNPTPLTAGIWIQLAPKPSSASSPASQHPAELGSAFEVPLKPLSSGHSQAVGPRGLAVGGGG